MTTPEPTTEPDWFLYVLRCADGSLYAGIATDLDRRVREHNESKRGARYTRARRPVTLIAAWPHADRSEATRAEVFFKRKRRAQKLAAIAQAPIRPDALV